uniref:Uncharacterized protein n=1 Tax=Aegilops tauschii subsp. strangulata TaxID=200361 RepID=A0A453DFK5_AEGTS
WPPYVAVVESPAAGLHNAVTVYEMMRVPRCSVATPIRVMFAFAGRIPCYHNFLSVLGWSSMMVCHLILIMLSVDQCHGCLVNSVSAFALCSQLSVKFGAYSDYSPNYEIVLCDCGGLVDRSKGQASYSEFG